MASIPLNAEENIKSERKKVKPKPTPPPQPPATTSTEQESSFAPPTQLPEAFSKNKEKKKAKETTVFTLIDYIGHEEVKKFLKEKLELMLKAKEDPTFFEKYKKTPFTAVLLYGPPGTGKTFLAKCLAGTFKIPHYEVLVSDILSSYVGDSEQKLEKVINEARLNQPSILVFDEFDSIGVSRRGAFFHGGEQVIRNIVNILNSRISEMERNREFVFLIATTNTPWMIDEALRRSGRFSYQFYLPPPGFFERIEYLKFYLKDIPNKINFYLISYLTDGFSQADLKQLVEEAKEIAIKKALKTKIAVPITTKTLIQIIAQEKVVPSTYVWYNSIFNSFLTGNLKVEDKIRYRPLIKDILSFKRRKMDPFKKLFLFLSKNLLPKDL